MVDDRASPSAGWREVYDEMGVDPDVEEPTRACPDCDRRCDGVLRDVHECPEHGVFRASRDARSDSSSDADDVDGADRHARGRAD